MKLYLISQDANTDYDTFDAIVVCAENGKEAVKIKPTPERYPGEWAGEWVENIKDIKCKYLGIADKSIRKGVILSSFNAG